MEEKQEILYQTEFVWTTRPQDDGKRGRLIGTEDIVDRNKTGGTNI